MRNLVIAIGREFGSGGKEIGQKLADRLNIKCYDSELLSIAAKNSGFCEEILQKNDEKPTNSFLYSLVMDTYSVSGYSAAPFLDMPLNHKIFLAQHRQQPVDGGNGDIEGRAQLFGGYHAVAAEDHLFQNVQHAIDALRAFDGLLVGIHNHSCRLKVADTMRRWKKAAKRKRAAPVRDGV
mgnify:CR=1 FL=1